MKCGPSEVQEVNLFIRCFRQRLIDNRWQDWKSRIDASDRFNFYRQFKTNHVQAVYPTDVNKLIRVVRLKDGRSLLASISFFFFFILLNEENCY